MKGGEYIMRHTTRPYSFEDVTFALDNKGDLEVVATKLQRTTGAINTLLWASKKWEENPKTKVVSSTLKQHFTMYAKQGETVKSHEVTVHPISKPAVQEDTCEKEIVELTASLEKGMEYFKERMAQLAESMVKHQNHLLIQKANTLETENTELRKWKENTNSELNDLRTFKENAQKSNFSSMLRKTLKV